MAKKKITKTHKICRDCKESLPLDNFKILINSKDRTGCGSICMECINKKSTITREDKANKVYCLYKFLDADRNVIYIGQTTNLDQRICSHKSGYQSNFVDFDLQVDDIEYAIFQSEYQLCIYEIHYIAIYKPELNKQYNNNISEIKLFDLPEVEWKRYYKKSNIIRYLIIGFGIEGKQAKLFAYNDEKVQRLFKLEVEGREDLIKQFIQEECI